MIVVDCYQVRGNNRNKNRKINMKYKTKLMIWSEVGHTPLTNRGGSYCDLLAEETGSFGSPYEARIALDKLLDSNSHAHKGYFEMPDHPNQNTRTDWVIKKINYNPEL